ncbi:MAG: hypothetical protein JXB07_14210 [Anaerolineae bacterium]|nr:hypothetical protein [Anaerolineae bacterium]
MSLPSTRQFVLISFVALALAACKEQDAPAQAIEGYIQALVDKDTDNLTNRSCAAWEEQAMTELDSFGAVSATLQDANCQSAGEDGDATLVTCAGSILATYNDEQREIGLDRQTYRAVYEGGEWRMCGYK